MIAAGQSARTLRDTRGAWSGVLWAGSKFEWHVWGGADGVAPHASTPQGLEPTALSCGDRYKMTCEYTWPNHLLGSDRAAVSALLEQHGLQGDVAFGHSKLFIRSPRTLVTLEQSRARLIPIIVLLLQKVRPRAPIAGAGGVCRPKGN